MRTLLNMKDLFGRPIREAKLADSVEYGYVLGMNQTRVRIIC